MSRCRFWKGSVSGQFTVVLDPAILTTPLVGPGEDQKSAWKELLLEVAKAAASELLVQTGRKCEVADLIEATVVAPLSRAFQLRSSKGGWRILICDETVEEVQQSLPEPRTDVTPLAVPKEAVDPVVLRHVADPVDLIVGDKIVARGDVVLVNGDFGLQVTEVAAPRKKLESIRCLF